MPGCLANLFRPNVARASMKLLNDYAKVSTNVEVVLARQQLCCGQPSYTNGDRPATQKLADHNIRQLVGEPENAEKKSGLLGDEDKLIIPSGSCVGMIKHHYPQVCSPSYKKVAQSLAEQTMELSKFLADALKKNKEFVGKVKENAVKDMPPLTVHRNCAALREIQIDNAIDDVVRHYTGNDNSPPPLTDAETCCGFGGTFCVKYPKIAARMAADKLNHLDQSLNKSDNHKNTKKGEKGIITSTDLGCLLHLSRHQTKHESQAPAKIYHLSEILSGEWRDQVPLGRFNPLISLKRVWRSIASTWA